MISSQSFAHLRISIRLTTDATCFVNGLANWCVLSTYCTFISPNLTILWRFALSTLSCITFEPFKYYSNNMMLSVLQKTLGTVYNQRSLFKDLLMKQNGFIC